MAALVLPSNPSHATLNGTLSVKANAGRAVFTGLSLGTLANGYILKATSGTLSFALSHSFNVTS